MLGAVYMKYPINEMLYLAISDGANIRIELIYTPRTLGRNGINWACSANHVPPYIWCHFIGALRFCQLGSYTDKYLHFRNYFRAKQRGYCDVKSSIASNPLTIMSAYLYLDHFQLQG